MLLLSVALGLLSGGWATFFHQWVMWETYISDPVAFARGVPFRSEESFIKMVETTGRQFNQLITAFKFFPAFLALGYVGYSITRWRAFQIYCYNLQNSLGNAALKVGSTLKSPSDERCKRLAFRVYRYLQVIHLLVHKQRNHWYQHLTMEDFIALGLLTEAEVKALEPADTKMHEVVISWLLRTIVAGNKSGLLLLGPRAIDAFDIRTHVASLNEHVFIGQPTLWAGLMKLVCDILILMFTVGSSFENFNYELGFLQPYVIIFTIILASPWLCASQVVSILEDPFNADHEMFNTDAFVANAERTTFLNLRCSWHGVADPFSEFADAPDETEANAFQPEPQEPQAMARHPASATLELELELENVDERQDMNNNALRKRAVHGDDSRYDPAGAGGNGNDDDDE